MCLAEALLRVPDAATIDDLIEDKIAPSRWHEHLDRANSPLVNVSTLALTLTGEVLRDSGAGIAGLIKGFVQRIGEPVIRSAVLQAMRILGNQFVLGRDIEEATRIARRAEKDGLHLFLRHARRSGAHRGRRAALPHRLCRGHRGARDALHRRLGPRQSRRLGQALGAPSALRVHEARAA